MKGSQIKCLYQTDLSISNLGSTHTADNPLSTTKSACKKNKTKDWALVQTAAMVINKGVEIRLG